MSEALHPNVVRVVEAARALGLEITPRRFPDGTKTAADAAAAIGVELGQIVKSLIFAVDGEVVLAYVSGSNQLDEKKLALAAGGLKCARVDADVVRQATGFPIGGVPPFGHRLQAQLITQARINSAAITPSITRPATFSFVRDLSMTNEIALAINAPAHAAPSTSAASLLAIRVTARPALIKSPP